MSAQPHHALAELLPPGADKRLKALLAGPEGFNLYQAIDNELFMRHGTAPRRLLIASAQAREGRTSIALLLSCLAAAYGADQRVLLLESVLGDGQIESRLGLETGASGFNQYNLEGGDWRTHLRRDIIERLDLLPAGASDWRHAKLNQANFQRITEEAAQDYRWIIVDSPPGGINLDVVSMSRMVDAVLMVIRYGGPTREQIEPMLERLRTAQAHILGAVLNQRHYPVPKLLYGTTG